MGIDIFQLPGILLKRWIYVLVTALLCAGLAAAYVTVKKPVYLATTDILIDPQGLAAAPPDLTVAGASASQDQGILESQLYVVQSREVLNLVVDKLDLTADRFLNPVANPDKEIAMVSTVNALQKNMIVERAGTSFVMSLSVKHRDVARAAEIANTIAAIYLKKLHEARTDASSRASGAFAMQAGQLAEKLRLAEETLEKFKAENGIVSTGQQGLVIDQQVEGVNKQLIAARADLELKRANYNQVKGLTVGTIAAGAIPEALASTSLSVMRSRYADMVSNANQMATTLGANHPQMQAARSQVASMTATMEQELARIRQSMKGAVERSEANATALQKRLDSLTVSSLDTSEAGIRARALLSETEALRALYKTFLTRAGELGQRDTVNINNSRIISKAVPVGTSSLVMKLIIIFAGGLFGIALGSGIAVLRELAGGLFGQRAAAPVDNTVPEGREIRQEPEAPVRVPVIAHIPQPVKRARSFIRNTRPVQEQVDPETERQIQIGVSRAVDTLLHMKPQHSGSMILFLSPDNETQGRQILPDIAGALHRLEKEVLYSSGESLGRADGSGSGEAPLGDILKFNRLSPVTSRRTTRSSPTFTNFSQHRRKADYVMIDASGEEARHHLVELLERADGILFLANEEDKDGRMDRLVQSLAPWKKRMLGTILVRQAA